MDYKGAEKILSKHINGKLRGKTLDRVELDCEENRILVVFDDGICLDIFTNYSEDLIVVVEDPSGD